MVAVVGIAPSCLSLFQHPLSFRKYIRRPQILASSCGDAAFGLRVFVLSDLHTDYSENMTWVKCLSTTRHKKDVLLVAGDVAETHNNFILTMSLLKDRFEHVFFVPGNHDLWCRSKGDNVLDSLEKLNKLLDACRGLGIETTPVLIDRLGIIPLFSWYHKSFDREKDITGIRIPSLEMACKDFHACKWPADISNRDTPLSLYFDAMNEKYQDVIQEVQRTCSQIITFSHFVPRQELCPEKRMLFYPNLPKIIGSNCLEVRIRSIHGAEGSASACHVFGHTHFCWDAVIDGIRPPTGWYKLNVDGSKKNSNHIAAGGVICDCCGNWLRGFACELGEGDNLTAEVWSLCLGLRLCVEAGIKFIEVESDCMGVIMLLKDNNSVNYIHWNVISECRDILGSMEGVGSRHVLREQNLVADLLANRAPELAMISSAFDEPPLLMIAKCVIKDNMSLMPRKWVAM